MGGWVIYMKRWRRTRRFECATVCMGIGWVGGWVGGWVRFPDFDFRAHDFRVEKVGGWVEENEAVRMRYCMHRVLVRWVGGWVGG